METNSIVTDDTNHADNASQLEQNLPMPKNTCKRRIIIFSVVSVINASLLIVLWTQLLTPAPNAGNGDNSVVDPLKGHHPPNFTLAALTTKPGSMLNLASYKGKAIVLNFWGATCVPCQDEAPMLQKEWQHAQSQGVVFIGVDFQDVQSDGLSFLQKYGITYPNALDTSGSTAINYGVTYTPTTYFINKQGIVVSSIPREMTASELQNGIQSLIKQ